ncbi:carbohydrate-binding protein SusD [Niastella yeongjuensis]|uniref:Carbohydrate-binding protein SusD n=1 Tax=Niastella yeongjuensis TaxID=354355 RepID=A0A1V9E3Q8_9BACT|nr:RagB/SusD family nutrient uptake outer membrane protein [Niastella yeongjuensis]OQP40767.1 carbohydrate-binding protein SusD [Niastella yeongjuensis]SEP02368.1 Starch-binding associating with outer membrane [Niastella yeongjuensis]
MKKIQTIYTLIAVSSLMTMMACNKILDITPVENNTSNKFYANEIDVKQATLGMYARLGRNGTNTDFATDYFWLASENRSDLLYIAGETSAQNDQLDLRKYLTTPTSGTVSAIFARLYQLIKEANNLLHYTPEDQYGRYRAEAKFLRAYAYSELVRSFGPVALITKPIENEEAVALPRTPAAEIYTQIIADLQDAAANLEKVYTGADAGRVGSLAANALLGQVYMTMAGYPLNDASAYAKAETVLGSIITDVKNRFAPVYANLFTLANENKYDLFSIQFASNGPNIGSSLAAFCTSSASSGTPFPEWMYATYSLQGQDMRVDSFLVNDMKAKKDLRFAASIDTGYWNALSTVTTRTFVLKNIVTKFLEKDNTNTNIKAWNDQPRNFPILRDADVYLLYAEALIKNGKAGDAKQYVDAIRTRAGQPVLAGAPTLDDIKRERKYEFIGEGRRYFDLVRWGETEAVNTLKTFAQYYHSKLNGQLPAKKDLLLPIPQNEMKTRTNWEQNLDY